MFAPDANAMHAPWLLMLWGYGLFQLAQGLRLYRWLGAQPFARGHWAYTFGLTSALNCALKFARAGIAPARVLAMPMLAAVTLFITWLLLHSARGVWQAHRPATLPA
jgi:tellurite resistance protein